MRQTPDHQVLSQESMLRFLRVFAEHGNVTLAARAIGTTPKTVHQWRRRSGRNRRDPRYLISDPLGDDPDIAFCDAWGESDGESLTPVRDTAMDMATGRHREIVVYKGEIMMERDYDAPPIRGAEGELMYPVKKDPLTGEPIPLLINKVYPTVTTDMLKARDPAWKPKSEVDLTTGGKPLIVPEKSKDMTEFLAEFGRKPETE